MADPILDAISRCNPNEPLERGDARFVNLDKVRGVVVQKKILRLMAAGEAGGGYAHVAFAGHRGSGKSTELRRLIQEAEANQYVTLTASITDEIDPVEISFSDLFRLMTSKLDQQFGDWVGKDDRVKEAFANVERWFVEVTKTTEEIRERALTLGGEAALGGNIEGEAGIGGAKMKSGLGRLLGAIAVSRKSRTDERQQMIQRLERYPDTLLEHLNLLLGEIRRASGVSKILFVLDNVDRYPPEMVSKVFLRNAELFSQIHAHLIFTIPVSLLYKPPEEAVPDRYRHVTLPMVPVYRPRSRQPDEDVIKVLCDALFQRVPAHLWRGQAARRLVLASGGCWRDLLRLAEAALLEASTAVEEADAERAITQIRTEAARPITQAQFKRLARVFLDKEIDSDEEGLLLLFRRAVLEYNGERWVDVHPLLEGAREFQAALQEVRTARTRSA